MVVDEPPPGRSRLDDAIRLVIVDAPDLDAPLVGALNAAEIGAWAWVKADKCLYWSPPVVDLLGIDIEPVEDLLSRFLRQVHPDDRQEVARMVSLQSRGHSFKLRFRFHTPRGERWLGILGHVQRDSSGAVIRQGGTLRDVTEEVEQQQERAEVTARLEALINAMPFAVWGRSGSEMRVSHQNAASIAWWGDLRGRTVADVPPDTARVWRQQIARVLSGEVLNVRTRYVRDNQAKIWNEIVAPVCVGGEVTGMVGVSIDVTEEQRQRDFDVIVTNIARDFVSRSIDTLDAALVNALERVGRFLDARIATICEIRPTEDFMRVTHWWIDPTTGATRPRFTQIPARDVQPLVERMRQDEAIVVAAPQDMREIDPEGKLDSLGFRPFVMVSARHTDDQTIIFGIASDENVPRQWPSDTVPMLRLAGAVLSSVLIRRQAEEQRQRVDRRMQDAQKLESLGILAGGVAHDFNNLLTAILGNASLVRSELERHSSLAGPLEQIEIASKRAADLCRQMLAYAGRGRVAVQSLDLNWLLRESESLLRVSVPKKAHLEMALAPELPPIVADLGQARQVVLNLVINAAEALAETEGTIRLETSVEFCTAQELTRTAFGPQLADGQYVRLAVSDTGAGMSAETMERIFDPFFTTKFTGRGLGLAAVIGIVRAHRGALRVASSVGQGSTFEVFLPAASEASHAENMGIPSAETLATWRTSGTVLVVDDESGVRELIRAVLTRAGFSVLLAENGRRGLEIFRQRHADLTLVLLDLRMPGLDGLETLLAMRKVRRDVPSILMSGYAPSSMAMPINELFLQKPFTPTTLRAAVWQALAVR